MGDGQFVDIFQFVAEADAAGDRGDLHAGEAAQAAHQIEERRFALDRGGDGQDHLLDTALRDAVAQQVDLQIGGRYALHGRDDTAQHMVEPLVLAGVLDRQHVGYLFHYADRRMVAFAVGADGAHLLVGEVVAAGAVLDVVAEAVDAAGHFAYRVGFHAQDVHGQAQCRAASHARQLRQLADHVL